MKKGFYSSSSRRPSRPSGVVEAPASAAAVEARVAAPAAGTWRNRYKRREKLVTFACGAVLSAIVVLAHSALTAPPVQRITQEDIDAAVLKTLQTKPLPSPATRAWSAVRGSIVRVRAIGDGLEHDEYAERSQGTGVVVKSDGVILTSLHVVAGASRVRIEFADGLEADATVVRQTPENDLAVLQAARVPDDLQAATLASAKAAQEGEQVTAVGFPYGIGPSVSAGVVSGLGRQYQAPDGGSLLRELIQFDAAVNPGSSGGPLVNAAGEVIGIVTALLSPGERGAFSGIGFAVPIQTAAAAAGLPPF
ncbi:MAG: S1C family serine protease [Betaproteobacteria bacterium]